MFFTLRLRATPAYTKLLGAIKVDLKAAMLAKDTLQKNTIRSVLSTIKNGEIDGADQSEFSVFKVLNKMAKQRAESEALYRSQGREDLAAVEAQEAAVIRKYVASLPVASDEEIEAKTRQWLADLHGKDSGKSQRDVMKQVTPELADSWSTIPAMIRAKVPKLYAELWK